MKFYKIMLIFLSMFLTKSVYAIDNKMSFGLIEMEEKAQATIILDPKTGALTCYSRHNHIIHCPSTGSAALIPLLGKKGDIMNIYCARHASLPIRDGIAHIKSLQIYYPSSGKSYCKGMNRPALQIRLSGWPQKDVLSIGGTLQAGYSEKKNFFAFRMKILQQYE